LHSNSAEQVYCSVAYVTHLATACNVTQQWHYCYIYRNHFNCGVVTPCNWNVQ